MSKGKLAHPFRWERPSLLWNLTNPSTVGTVFAGLAAALPKRNIPFVNILNRIAGGETSQRLLLSLIGFLLGYISCKGCDALRLRALKSLLTYQGWVTHPKSKQTKLWGILLSLLRGRQPFSTFQFQRFLPKQPLPDLDQTLDNWLKQAEVLLSPDECELTKEIVENFRRNEGPTLQKFLIQRAAKTDTWLHDYWMMAAYLSTRDPLPVNSNYYVGHKSDNPDVDGLARGATNVYWMARLERLLSSEKFPPVLIQNMVPLCMHGFSFVFNSNRIPGEYIDEMVRHPGYGHVVVIRNGNYFKLNLYLNDRKDEASLLTPHEIKIQLERIMKTADQMKPSPPVAALTTQNRSVWAKQRKELMASNEEIVKDIETCMFVISLEDTCPKDYAAHGKNILVGDGSNRWFDKCATMALMKEGWSGFNTEHSGIDAMVCTNAQEYCCTFEEYDNNDVIKTRAPRDLPAATKLEWNLDGMIENINKAAAEFKTTADDVLMTVLQPSYGKGYIKKQRISPDGYIQMAMQLAYYRMHKFIPRTYEPSTHRLFHLGRTETVHVYSKESVAFVKAMDDESMNSKAIIDLLKKAIAIQTDRRLKATIGQGCDRHLVALLCASKELGMDLPKIFTEKTWRMPYLLSTSQTPNYLYEYGCKADIRTSCGGFGPSHQDGYGVCYGVLGDDLLNIHISSWQSSTVSDGARFAYCLNEALEDMKKLVD